MRKKSCDVFVTGIGTAKPSITANAIVVTYNPIIFFITSFSLLMSYHFHKRQHYLTSIAAAEGLQSITVRILTVFP